MSSELAETRPVGRPLKFSSVEELDERIEAYFRRCKRNKEKPLITGLALWLDCERETLANYGDRPEYSASIKKAKLRCELALEHNLVEGKVNPTGTIFTLKNNYGWADRTETDFRLKEVPAPIFPELPKKTDSPEST